MIDLDALVSPARLPKVRLYGRELVVRPMTGAAAHRIAAVQAESGDGAGMFAVLLDVVARSIPELSEAEVAALSVEQVMALVQLTRGQVAEVEQTLAAQAEVEQAGN